MSGKGSHNENNTIGPKINAVLNMAVAFRRFISKKVFVILVLSLYTLFRLSIECLWLLKSPRGVVNFQRQSLENM